MTFPMHYGIISARETAKNLALGGAAMYRYSDGQISLTDFEQPMGMKLREDNRWVKKAQIIPWVKIKKPLIKSSRSA